MHKLLSAGLLALLASGPFLAAQEFRDSQAGFQLGVSFPQGDLKTVSSATFGFQAGLHVGFALAPGQDLRPRLDYTRYEGGSAHGLSLNDTVYAFGLGADYLYYLEGRRRGTYLLGGLTWNWWKVDSRDTDAIYTQAPRFAAGIGHRFSPKLSAEVTVAEGRFKPSPGDGVALGFNLSFSF